MALSATEDRYLSALTEREFPTFTPEESAMAAPEGVDGMQLAAGPSATMSDAGGGMGEIKAYDPTTREKLADFLQAGFERFGMDRYKARQRAQTMIGGPSSNLPLNLGLADVVPFLGTALQTEESLRMGGEAVDSAKRGDMGTAALQAGGAALGLVPGAVSTAKAVQSATKSLSKTQPQASTINPNGVSYATTQEGPFYRVSKASDPAGQATAKEGRFFPGTALENRAGSGRSSVYGDAPGQADQELQLRLSPDNNNALRVAEQFTQQNVGQPYRADLEIEPSSLKKQSAVGIAYDLAATRSPGYDQAVFNAYKVDPEYGPVIEGLGLSSYDDLVKAAYQQLEKETIDQFNALPVSMSYHKSGEGNYLDSKEMLRDVHLHNHLFVYQGGDRHEFLNKVDPATGLNSNEMFRAVHDYFGHAIKGNAFGPIGEEVAWASHAQMYSPLARIAMSAETRGQNSFVNYTPINAELVAQMEDVRRAMVQAQRSRNTDKVEQYKQVLRDLGSQWQYAQQASVALPPEMTKLDYAGQMPDYLRATQGTKGETVPVEHYSKAPDMATTEPSKYGTGAKGRERDRLEMPNARRERTFFYEAGGRPEEVVVSQAPYKYKSIAEGLYDFDKDPLNLRKLARVRNTSPASAKYNADVLDEPSMLNDMERMIFERGFKGYVSGKQGSRVVVSFEPVPVERTN
jgi:hypothetical protein